MKINSPSRLCQLWIYVYLRMFSVLMFVFFFSTPSIAQMKVDVAQFIARAENVESEDIGEGVISKTYTDKSKTMLSVWHDGEKLVPRLKGAIYCYVVPGPKEHFLRKAWLSADGSVLEEERRNYDAKGRLVVEGYVDPSTGAFSEEYRHRYSEDGKIQYTTHFSNGVQVGAETSRALEE